jgi:glutaredoxin
VTEPAAARRLTLYGRRGCHLCEVMLAALPPQCREPPIALEVVDVDGDPELAGRFGSRVPVLCLDGREICHHHLDSAALSRALG